MDGELTTEAQSTEHGRSLSRTLITTDEAEIQSVDSQSTEHCRYTLTESRVMVREVQAV